MMKLLVSSEPTSVDDCSERFILSVALLELKDVNILWNSISDSRSNTLSVQYPCPHLLTSSMLTFQVVLPKYVTSCSQRNLVALTKRISNVTFLFF